MLRKCTFIKKFILKYEKKTLKLNKILFRSSIKIRSLENLNKKKKINILIISTSRTEFWYFANCTGVLWLKIDLSHSSCSKDDISWCSKLCSGSSLPENSQNEKQN